MDFKEMLVSIGNWLGENAASFGFKLIGAVIVLIVGLKLVKWVLKLIQKTEKFSKIDPGAETFIFSAIGIILRVFVIFTAIAIIGVPMTNFVAILGSAGLAVGLALQGSLSNFAGGLMILIFKPFTVGNFITAGDISGTVKEINILYTILDTPDNTRVVVPNGSLSNATIKNVSSNTTRRVDFTLGVAYNSNLKKVIEILTQMAEADERVLKDKPVFAKILSYDESQITVAFRVWVESADYWDVFFDLNAKVKQVFDENKIEIPFPQLDVHIAKDDKE